jgi:hypothetical protein
MEWRVKWMATADSVVMYDRDGSERQQWRQVVRASAAGKAASDAMVTRKAASDAMAMKKGIDAMQQQGKNAVRCECGDNTRPGPEGEEAKKWLSGVRKEGKGNGRA